MNVAIRVDASNQIGTGHFMRCLTLADSLRLRGAGVRFTSRNLPAHLREMLSERGHEFVLLPSASIEAVTDDLPHSRWLGTSQLAIRKPLFWRFQITCGIGWWLITMP